MDDEFPPLPATKNNDNKNNTENNTSTTSQNIIENKTNLEINSINGQQSKRSRSSPNNLNNKRKQATLSDYWLAASDNNRINRFEILSDEDDDEALSAEQIPATKPPPIFVSMVENAQPLICLLNSVANNGFEIKVLRDNEIKIQPSSEETYSVITKALIEKNTQFHTYKLKGERPFNVVVKGLHQSSSPEDIKIELESLGFDILNVSNVKHRLTKKPLPMFYVNMKQNANNKDIYKIEHLLYTKILVEPPRKKREIPQCHKCQRYGHTYKMCNHNPRCVKCAGPHSTSECARKEKSKDVKCVLCEGNHPANYKGCMIYKELQQKTFPTLRKKVTIQKIPDANVNPGISYAQIASEHNQTDSSANPPQNQSSDISELKSMVMMLLQQMNNMFNVLNTVLLKMSK